MFIKRPWPSINEVNTDKMKLELFVSLTSSPYGGNHGVGWFGRDNHTLLQGTNVVWLLIVLREAVVVDTNTQHELYI